MQAISSYKAQIEKYGAPISESDYTELRGYAKLHRIKLSGFRDFVGDISTIKTVIDDIARIAEDFPLIIGERHGICLKLDYNLGADFATTQNGHIIHLNGGYYAEVELLNREYVDGVDHGRFVKGTDWRAIARHETGHVVANLYQLKPIDIALHIKKGMRIARLLEDLENNLSLYSAEYEDGREIISECFSAYYSEVKNNFAEQFLALCKEATKYEII